MNFLRPACVRQNVEKFYVFPKCRGSLFMPWSPGQKLSHLAKDFRLSVNETNVIGVGERDDPAIWNLSAKMFDFILVIFALCYDKLLRVFSLRLGQRFSPIEDFFRSKPRHLEFAGLWWPAETNSNSGTPQGARVGFIACSSHSGDSPGQAGNLAVPALHLSR